MVFSSAIFLFVFLPLVMGFYYLLSRSLKNLFLLVASLLFYAWGEMFYVLIMLASIAVNYVIGLLINWRESRQTRKIWLATGIAANLALLGFFKYANFLVENFNHLLAQMGLDTLGWSEVHLPLGISFFTFQAMSYLIDVYRRQSAPQSNPVNVALYISLFPQLIAGPIVRYHDIAEQIVNRVCSLNLVNSGIQRFIYGLAKKVLIANPMGLVADQIFAIDGGQLTPGLAWLGVACYTLQIYFDFSGYSDMAIGLGRMFGFRFLENFNYPYISRSIKEFWRRWHISLSSWFRDYLYIPLGGNRRGAARTHFNLLVVFVLCGLWHGASWTFLVWGLYHGVFLVLERTGFGRLLAAMPGALRHAYTLLVVMVGWVFFRTESLPEAIAFLEAMAGFAAGDGQLFYAGKFLDAKVTAVLLAGAVLATPAARNFNRFLLSGFRSPDGQTRLASSAGYSLINLSVLVTLLALSLMSIAANAYSPFIYFRF